MTALLLMPAYLPCMILYPCNVTLYISAVEASLPKVNVFTSVFLFEVMRPQPPHISPQRSGNSTNSPKHPRPLRPQPPPPPGKSKEEHVWESTDLWSQEISVSHQFSNVSYLWQNHNSSEERACDTFRTLFLCSVVFAAGGGKQPHRYGKWKCLGIHF